MCCNTRFQQQPQASRQGQKEEDLKDSIDLELFPKVLYIQACGELAGHLLKAAPCQALCEASTAAALVCQLKPHVSSMLVQFGFLHREAIM